MMFDLDTIAPNFTMAELQCKCGCGMLPNMTAIHQLQKLREALGFPMVINSGARCEEYNRKVGGAKNSQHMHGLAFDIRATPLKRAQIIHRAREFGFNGIGVYMNFVHIDQRHSIAVWEG